ncbi:Por secretion system C-terminal sorting domain-containing protein [Salinimicrobium sediminis]|uniref:Por secretion system C-terminal sorting domain-containing protein n=1 Tax=Salinimicrobium sediminis TaxID=1343891 RepID=A0A285X5U2_9FLAO|nr:T9SS type A sorting domain-containing protein [Salinimicrobium sediminis]SOC80675.1 Por secretion system C-terminal sorting domain-containing protein [Salinimicrobium sediminis]
MKSFTIGSFPPKEGDLEKTVKVQTSGWSNFVGIAILLFIFSLNTNLFAQQPSISLEQVRNGSADDPLNGVDPPTEVVNWQNGNLGPENSHYFEGASVPYRAIMKNLPAGQPAYVIIEYDIKHSGSHALDYLTHYDRIWPHELAYGHPEEDINPLIGYSALSGITASTAIIPVPTKNKTLPSINGQPGISQPETSAQAIMGTGRDMTLWNGTITGVSYVAAVPGDLDAEKSAQQVRVDFITGPAGGTAILAWGGHIANRNDWDYGDGMIYSAGDISGSPYHMRLKAWAFGNIGNEDRSLKAEAVIAAPECSLEDTRVCEGETNIAYTVDEVDPQYLPEYHWSIESTSGGSSDAEFDPQPGLGDLTVYVDAGSNDFVVKLNIITPFGNVECESTTYVDNKVTAGTGKNDEYCESNSALSTVDLFALLDGEDAGGKWTDSNNTEVTSPIDLSSKSPGTYTYTYTVTPTSPSECPPDSESVSIRIDGTVTAGTGSSVTYCEGDSALSGYDLYSLLSDEGPNGQWTDSSNNPVTSPVDLSSASPGTYTYTYTVTPTSPSECLPDNESVSIIIEACCSDETAYAYGTRQNSGPFCNQPGGGNNWGWSIGLLSKDTAYTFDMYAGASKCNPSRGVDVGDVSISYEPGFFVVTFLIEDNISGEHNKLLNAQVYIGCQQFPSYYGSPGQYPFRNVQISSDETSGIIRIPLGDITFCSNNTFYFIAHADVDVCEGTRDPAPSTATLQSTQSIQAESLSIETVENDVSVSPVPFDEEINVSYDLNYTSDVTIEIFDFGGNLLRTVKDSNVSKGSSTSIGVDFSIGANQMYLLRVTTDRETFVKQIVSSKK